jgi:hypothetical protein
MNLFHFHKWTVADSKPITVTEYGYFLMGVYSPFPEPVSRPETQVLYRCTCGEVKAEKLFGHWDFELLANGAPRK